MTSTAFSAVIVRSPNRLASFSMAVGHRSPASEVGGFDWIGALTRLGTGCLCLSALLAIGGRATLVAA